MTIFDYLFHHPHLSWIGVLTFFFLTLMRIVPIVALAPFLGAKTAPIVLRMGLAIVLSFFFLPLIISHSTHALGFTYAFLGYSLKELGIGLILAFFITVPFYMAQTSGIIIDYLRGASIMQSQDPSMQNQTSPIGILYNYILIVVFFYAKGPSLFLNALMTSYEIFPVDQWISPLFFNLNTPFWKMSVDLVNQVVSLAIQLAAPSLVAILMAEMFLGIANRLAPQVQIAFLGMSIKSFLGLALLWAAWFFILKQFDRHCYSWIDTIDKLLESCRVFLS